MKKIVFLLLYIFLALNMFGVTYTWTGLGDGLSWNDESNWNDGNGFTIGDGFPDDINDNAIINSAVAVDMNSAGITINNLTINNAGASLSLSGNLTVDGITTVTSGNLIVGANTLTTTNLSVSGTLDNSNAAGVVNCNGTTVDFSGGSYSSGGTFNINGAGTTFTTNNENFGTLNITGTGSVTTLTGQLNAGNVTVDGSISCGANNVSIGALSGTGTFNAGSGTVGITGDVTVTTFDAQTSTLSIDGTINSTGDFTASSGNTTLTGDLTVGGTFDANSGTFVINGNTSLGQDTVFNNLTINDSFSLSTNTRNITAASLLCNGKLDASLGGNINITGDVTNGGSGVRTITGGAGTITFGGNVDLTTLTGGAGAIDINGDINITGNFTASSGNTTLTGDLTVGGIFNNGGAAATFIFDGTGNINQTTTFNNLSLIGGIRTIFSGTTTVNGIYTQNGGDISIGDNTLVINAPPVFTSGTTIIVDGVLDLQGVGNITFSATTINITGIGSINCSGNSFDMNGGSISLGSGSLDCSGFSVSAGTFDAGSGTIISNGDISITAGFTQGSSNINMTGGNSLQATTLNNLTVNTGGVVTVTGGLETNNLTITSGTLNAGGLVTVNGNLVVDSIFNLTNNNLDVTGTLTVNNPNGDLNSTTGNISIGSTSSINDNLSTTSGTMTFGSTVTVENNGVITNGSNTLTVNAGGVVVNGSGAFNGGTGDITISAGGVSGTGTFNAGSGTVGITGDITVSTFDGETSTLSINGAVNTAGNFTASSGNTTLTGNLAVGGTFNNGGVAATFIFDGTTTIITNNLTFNDIEITSGNSLSTGDNIVNVSGNATIEGTLTTGNQAVSIAGDATGGGNLTCGSGTLDVNGDFNITGNTTFSSATSNIGGNFTATGAALTNTGAIIFDGMGTINANGKNLGDIQIDTNRSLSDALTCGNLTINNLATLTTGANDLTCNNLLLNGTGTLLASGQGAGNSITINGSATGSGILTCGTGAITINGDLDIHTFTASSGNTTLTGNLTVGGTFDANGGTFIFDGNTTLGSNGLVFNEIQINNGDFLVIGNNSITVNGDATINGIFDSSGQIAGGNTTTINGVVSGTGTLTGGSQAITIGSITSLGTLTGGAGAIDINGNATITTFNEGAGNTNLGGDFAVTNFTDNATGTLIFDGAGTTIDANGQNLGNIEITTDRTLSDALTCGNLTITAGTLTIANNDLTVNGNLYCNGTLDFSEAGNANNLNLNGAIVDFTGGTFTKGLNAGDTVNIGNAGTVTFTGNANDFGNVIVTSPTLNNSGNNTFSNLTLTGSTFNSGTANVTVNNDLTGTGTFDGGNGNITINGNSSVANLTASSGNTTLRGNLTVSGTFSNGGAAATFIFNNSSTINTNNLTFNNIQINNGKTLNDGGNIINVNKNWDNQVGTFTSTGTVNLTTATTATISGDTTFNNLNCTENGKTINLNGDNTIANFNVSSTVVGQTVNITGSNNFTNLSVTAPTGTGQTITVTNGTTQAASGNFTLTGTAGNLITLQSSSSGVIFTINDTGTESISFVKVSDCTVNGITASSSKNVTPLNNVGWTFNATTVTWTGLSSTSWNTPANWNLGYVPNDTDNVIIPNVTNDPLIGSATTVNNLTITADATGFGLLSTNNQNLTVTGILSFTSSGVNFGTLRITDPTNIVLVGTWLSANGTVEYSDIGGNLNFTLYNNIIISGGGTFNTAGITNITGNLTISSTGTILMGHNVNIVGNLTMSDGVIAVGTNTLDIDGTRSLTGGEITISTGTLDLRGNSTALNGTDITLSSNGAIDSTGEDFSVSNAGSDLKLFSGNLTCNNYTHSLGNLEINTGKLICAALSQTGGSIDAGTNSTDAITCTDFSVSSGTFDANTSKIISTGTAFSITTGATNFICGSSTIQLQNAGTTTLSSANNDINNLIINTTGTVQAGTSITQKAGSGTLAFSADGILNLNGNTWTLGMDFTQGTGTVAIGTGIFTGAASRNVTLNAGGEITIGTTGTLTALNIALNGGTFTCSGNSNINANGDFTLAGGVTWDPGSSTVRLQGANGTVTALQALWHFRVSQTVYCGADLTLDGTLTIDNTRTFWLNNNPFTTAYNLSTAALTINGTGILNASNQTGANTFSVTGTTNFAANGTITGGQATLDFNIVTNGTNTATINCGQVTTGNNALLTSGNFTIGTLNGNTITNPVCEFLRNVTITTYNHNNDKILFSGNLAQSFAPGGSTYYDIEINKSANSVTPSATINIAHDFNNSTNSFTHGNQAINFNGTTAQTFTSGTSTYYDIIINNGGGGTVSLNSAILYVGHNFTNTSGTFAHNDKKIIFNGTVAQTITTGGTGVGKNFYDIEISSSNTVSLAAGNDLTQETNGVLTMTSGTLNLNNRTWTLGFNFTQGAGILTIGTGTFNGYDGTATYYDLTFNAGSTVNHGASAGTLRGKNISINGGTYNLNADSIFDVYGDFTILSAAVWSVNCGDITMNSGGNIRVEKTAGNSIRNLTVNTSGTVLISTSDLFMSGNFLFQANTGTFNQNGRSMTVGGTFTINNGSTYTANNLNVAGDFTLNATSTFNAGGTLTFNGTGNLRDNNGTKLTLGAVVLNTAGNRTQTTDILTTSLTINAGRTYITDAFNLAVLDYLTVNGTGALNASGQGALNTISIGGDASFGTFSKGSGTVIFNGGDAQSFTPNSRDFGNVQTSILNTIVTMTGIATMDDLIIDASTTFQLNGAGAACTLNINDTKTVANSGIFKVFDSTNAVTLKSVTTTFNFTGIDIDYNNDKKIYLAGVNYSPEIILGGTSETVQLSAGTGDNCTFSNITINAGGTFHDGNQTFNLSGNWTNSATGIATLGGTINFTGAATQDITSARTPPDVFTADANHDFNIVNHTGTGTVRLIDSMRVKSNFTNSAVGTFNLNDQNIAVVGNLTISSGTLDASTGTPSIYVGGNWSKSGGGVFTYGASTVVFNEAMGNIQNIETFFNLSASTGTHSATGGNITVSGNLSLSAGATLTLTNAYTLSVTGDTDNYGTITSGTGTGSQTYTGTFTNRNSGTVMGGGGANAGALTFNNSFSSAGNVNCGNSGNGNDGLVFNGTASFSSGTLVGNATTNPNIRFTGTSIDFTGLTTLTQNNDLVIFSGANNQDFNSGAKTFQRIEINKSSNAVTLRTNNLTLTGNLSITSGTLSADDGGTGRTITLGGNWSNSGTFTCGNGTLVFNGSANEDFTPGASNYYNIEIKNTGAVGSRTVRVLGGVTQDTNGGLTMTSGTLNLNGNTWTLGANFAQTLAAPTLAIGTGTFTGGSSYSVSVSNGTVTHGATGTLTASSVSITGGTYTCSGASTINTNSNFTLTGTAWTLGNSVVNMNGTGDINASYTLYDLNISPTAAQIVSIKDNNLAVGNNLTVGSNGTLRFEAPSNKTLTVTGTTSNDGTITGADTSGLITFNGNLDSTTSGTVTAGEGGITCSGTADFSGGGTLNGSTTGDPDLTFNDDLTFGTFNHNNDKVVVKGGDFTTNGQNLYDLDITTGTVMLYGNLNVQGVLSIPSGTLAAGTNPINIGATGVTPSGLTISGTGNFTYAAGQTITFQGNANQTLTWTSTTTPAFYNLTIDKNSANNLEILNASKDITINGLLEITNGELIQNRTITLANTGNLLNSISIAVFGKWTNTTGATNCNINLGGTATNGNVNNLGVINFDGGASKNLQIRSSGGNQRDWKGSGTFTVGYVDVQDQTCISGTPTEILCENGKPGIDSGNNINWFLGIQTSFVRGTVYSDKGSSPVGVGIKVKLMVRTTAPTYSVYYTNTIVGGVYNFDKVYLGTDYTLHAFVENSTPSLYKGNSLTIANNDSSDITGFDIYNNFVITRCDKASGTINNANLNTMLDSTRPADMLYSYSAPNLTLNNGVGLVVWGGSNFTPGGNVTTQGTGSVDIRGTFTNEGNILTIAGDLLVNGGILNATGTGNINCSGGTVDFTTGSFTKGTGIFTFNRGALQLFNPNSTNVQDFGNVTLSTNGTIVRMNRTAIMDNLNISANTTFQMDGTSTVNTLNINNGRTITNNGVFQVFNDTNSVTLMCQTGVANFTVNDIDYNGRKIFLNGINYSPTVNLGNNEKIELSGANCSFTTVNIYAGGEFIDGGETFNITGNWSNAGSCNMTGTALFNGVNQSINGGGFLTNSAVNNLTHSGTGSLQLITTSLEVKNNFINNTNNFNMNSQDLYIAKDFTLANGTTFTNTGATIHFNGTTNFTDNTNLENVGNIIIETGSTLSLSTTIRTRDITINGTGVFTNNNYSITLLGNWTNNTNGVFNHTGIIYFAGSANQNITTAGIGVNHHFVNLIHSGSAILTFMDDIRVTGYFNNSNGTTNQNDRNFYVNGNFTLANGTTYNRGGAGTGLITFEGATTYNDNTAAFQNIGNILIFDNKTLTLNTNMRNDNITINVGAVFTDSGRTIFTNGNYTNNGTVNFTGTIDFTGAAQSLTSGGTTAVKRFQNLIHSGSGTLGLSTNDIYIKGNFTNSNNTFKLNDFDMTILGNFNISGGTVDASDTIPADTSEIYLSGNWTNSGGVFNSDDSTVFIAGTANQTISAEPGFNNLIFNKSSNNTIISGDVSANYMVLYRGGLAFSGGYTLYSKGDILFLGATAVDSSVADGWAGPPRLFDTGTYNGSFNAGGSGPTIRVDGDFYVNGCDMIGTAVWYLILPDNDDDVRKARAYGNIVVSYSEANFWVSAIEPKGASPVDNGNNERWDFLRPEIVSVETVSDKVIRIIFNKPLENSNNEIWSSVTDTVNKFITYDNNPNKTFIGSYTDITCGSGTETTGKGDWGDLTNPLYILCNETWNTDASGDSIGSADSTDRAGVKKNITINFNLLKGAFRDARKNQIDEQNYTNVIDRCSPVLLSATLGTESEGDNNFNFIRFIYSEPISSPNITSSRKNSDNGANSIANGDIGGGLTTAGTFKGFGSAGVTGNVVTYSDSGTGTTDGRDDSNTVYKTNNGTRFTIRLGGNVADAGCLRGDTIPGGAFTSLINITDHNGNQIVNDFIEGAVTVDYMPVITGSWILTPPNFTMIKTNEKSDLTDGYIDRLVIDFDKDVQIYDNVPNFGNNTIIWGSTNYDLFTQDYTINKTMTGFNLDIQENKTANIYGDTDSTPTITYRNNSNFKIISNNGRVEMIDNTQIVAIDDCSPVMTEVNFGIDDPAYDYDPAPYIRQWDGDTKSEDPGASPNFSMGSILPPNQKTYHNYILFRYSEPIVDFNGVSIDTSSDGYNFSADQKSSNSLGDFATLSNNVSVKGFGSFTGNIRVTDGASFILRDDDRTTILHVAGFYDGTKFIGHITNQDKCSVPNSTGVYYFTTEDNNTIVDSMGLTLKQKNVSDNNDLTINFLKNWDITPPDFREVKPTLTFVGDPYLLSSGATYGSPLITCLEFVMTEAIRDLFIGQSIGNAFNFTFHKSGEDLSNATGLNFSTIVNRLADIINRYDGSQINDADPNDQGFSVYFDTVAGMNDEVQIKWTYNAFTGEVISDLRGNMLPDVIEFRISLENSPPYIIETRAVVGANKVYVEFNETVLNKNYSDITINDFNYVDTINGTNSLIDIQKIDSKRYIFTFSENFSQNNIVEDIFNIKVGEIQDAMKNTVKNLINVPLSFIGINFFEGITLEDFLHRGEGWSVTNFSGSEKINMENMKVTAKIDVNKFKNFRPILYFDVLKDYKFWYPNYNREARMVLGKPKGNNIWEFTIPSNDSKISSGNQLSFVFKIGDLYCYRSPHQLDSPDFTPYDAETYSVKLQEIKLQNSDVTILNNVINPNNNENTKFLYTLQKEGPVSIVVYDLAGNIVKVLKGEAESAGSHIVTWDGRNNNGKIVTRGVYLIRIRAPGIFNQMRKVLVVK